MNATIVEKTLIDLKTGKRINMFAIATSDKNPLSVKYSLTHEAHLTEWTEDRKELEDLLEDSEYFHDGHEVGGCYQCKMD